jgi:hypothetical protein
MGEGICQWTVGSGQLTVVSGQWSVDSGQWSVVGLGRLSCKLRAEFEEGSGLIGGWGLGAGDWGLGA